MHFTKQHIRFILVSFYFRKEVGTAGWTFTVNFQMSNFAS